MHKGKPVPFSSLRMALVLVLMLYTTAVATALLLGNWSEFANLEQAIGMVGAMLLMAGGAACGVRLGNLACAAGIVALFALAGATVAIRGRVEGELSLHDALVFPGAGIVFGFGMLATFVAVTHIGARRGQ